MARPEVLRAAATAARPAGEPAGWDHDATTADAAAVREFYDDHVTLRRYLVDAGPLAREAGVYWRSGGTVEV